MKNNKIKPNSTISHSSRSEAVSRDYHGRVLDQPGANGATGVGGHTSDSRIQALNPTRTRPSAVPGMIETMGPG